MIYKLSVSSSKRNLARKVAFNSTSATPADPADDYSFADATSKRLKEFWKSVRERVSNLTSRKRAVVGSCYVGGCRALFLKHISDSKCLLKP